MNPAPIDAPLKVSICTGYPFVYMPVLDALKELHPYILSDPGDADLIIVDQVSTVKKQDCPPQALFLGVSGEAYGMFPYKCDFEVGAHIFPKNPSLHKAWLPYIPIINSPFESAHLQSVRREQAWPRKNICFIASHDTGWRTAYVQMLEIELMRYGLHIDFLGKIGNNAEPLPGDWQDTPKVFAQYKCVIALENQIHPGYITEKIPNALLGRTVPITIYPKAHSVYPFPDTMDWQIHTTDSYNPAKFAKEIRDVLSDPAVYLQKWDANPLCHTQFYENYRHIYRGVQRLAATIIDRWVQLKK